MLTFRTTIALAMLVCAAPLGGCGGVDGIELNGAVFDYLGVGSNTKKAEEARAADRQGLVLPPSLDRLPEPGSGVAATGSIEAFPVNPEERKVAANSAADRQHAEYCEKALQKARVMRDLSPVVGPKGRCERSIVDQVNVDTPFTVDAGGPAARKP